MEYDVITPKRKWAIKVPSISIQAHGIHMLSIVQDHLKVGDSKNIRVEVVQIKSGPHKGRIAFRKVPDSDDPKYHLVSRYNRPKSSYAPYVINSSIVAEIINRDVEAANGRQKSKSIRVKVILGKDEFDWVIVTTKII